MTLKSLEEINRDFMIETPALEQKTELIQKPEYEQKPECEQKPEYEQRPDYKPITPLVFDVELPEWAPPHTAEQYSPDVSEISDTQSGQSYFKKERGLLKTISDVLFTLAIVMIFAVILMSGSDNGMPKTILGYSYFSVQSPSMQDEIPKGAFILVKHVDPQALEIGDNITFMVDRSTSWTHKIVNIYEDYDRGRARAFQTKGVNNIEPDEDLVDEANIVGKVILVIPVLGAILMNLGQNVFLVFIIFALCVLFSFLIRGVFVKPESGDSDQVSVSRGQEPGDERLIDGSSYRQ